jgi:hypothetical protein
MSLALNHDKYGGNDNQNQKNPHFDHPPFCARRKVYERAANKKGRARVSPGFHGAVIRPGPAWAEPVRGLSPDLGRSSHPAESLAGRALPG